MIFVLEKCLVCTYCQDEFEVIGYRADSHKFSNYKLITVYTCCSNKETCDNFYLCLVVSFTLYYYLFDLCF